VSQPPDANPSSVGASRPFRYGGSRKRDRTHRAYRAGPDAPRRAARSCSRRSGPAPRLLADDGARLRASSTKRQNLAPRDSASSRARRCREEVDHARPLQREIPCEGACSIMLKTAWRTLSEVGRKAASRGSPASGPEPAATIRIGFHRLAPPEPRTAYRHEPARAA